MAAVVDGGLGRFLQFVQVEPVLEGEQFRGFQVVALYPPETWRTVDLRIGDLVTSVNGRPIGRENEAHAAFLSVRDVKELRVRFQRGSEERELVFRVIDKPGIVIPPPPKQPAPRPGLAAAPPDNAD